MSEADRLALYDILGAFKSVSDLVQEALARRPNDPGLIAAGRELRPSFHLRLYAEFEAILARRANGEGLASYVRWEVGEMKTLDPAPPHEGMEWWRLLRRDRNHLAHGSAGPPTLDLSETLKLFESYLAMRTERNP